MRRREGHPYGTEIRIVKRHGVRRYHVDVVWRGRPYTLTKHLTYLGALITGKFYSAYEGCPLATNRERLSA